MTFTFPKSKEDFTAENGVTYRWEENRWRTKSFLTADGQEVDVGENPPLDPSEGALWYDSTRLELFVYYVDPDGVGGWVPSSPLGARVEAGEQRQQALIGTVGAIQDDYLSKSKGGTIDALTTITHSKASSDSSYVFSVKGSKMTEGKDVAFRVTASGSIKAGHDTSNPFLAVSPNDVITKAYFDANKGEGGDGGSPDPRLPYRLGTDKAIRSTEPAAADPSIELVDGEDMYSNVYIRGTGGITTSSDANAVRIDGSALLPLTGGTLNGNLEMSGGYIKCLNGQPTSWFDQSGNWAAEFKGKGDKTFQMVSAQGVSIEWAGRTNNDVAITGVKFDPRLMQWEFTNVKEPEASTDVATRRYVDQQVVSAGQSWAPSKFKYISDGTTQNINPGEFYIGSSSGQRSIVLHHSMADGVNWTFHEANVDWKQEFNGPCCIRKIDGTIVFQADMVSMTCYGLPNDRKHVTIKTLNSRKLDLTNSEEYVIYIPGILPRFILS